MPPNPPNEPTSLDAVKVLAKHCGDRRSGKVRDQGGITTLISSEKNTKKHILLRLRRDRPYLAARVEAGAPMPPPATWSRGPVASHAPPA
jgi:hypothetical protein